MGRPLAGRNQDREAATRQTRLTSTGQANPVNASRDERKADWCRLYQLFAVRSRTRWPFEDLSSSAILERDFTKSLKEL